MTVRTLAAVLAAAVLAGCGGTGEEGVPPAPDAGPPVGGEPPADETQTCENAQAGFTIAYPGDWHTNAENGLPPCSVFDPDPIALPEAGEVPPALAVAIRRDDTPFEDMIAEDEFDERISEEEGTIGGRPALRVESRATGAGLLDEGTVSYRYYVDLDGQTLVAETNDVEAADFARNREMLDRMMETIQIQDFR